jgi:LysR family transcriptional regulator, transcriptional activator of the cysJI operon
MENWLNPQWLRSFRAICETGSFTRAAIALDLTQAAISQQLQRLEEVCGPLLLRKARPLELTPAGHKVLAHARALALAHERLKLELEDRDPHAGTVSIATPGSIGLALYPALLALQVEQPGVAVHHRAAPTADVLRAVLEQRCELGIVTREPDDVRLQARRFGRERLCLVLPKQHACEDWESLVALGFIDHPDGREMRQRLLARVHPGRPVDQIPVRGFTNQIGAILDPVAAGLGFTVLPHFAVAAYPHQGKLHIAEGGARVIDQLWLVQRAQWPLSAAAAWALARLEALDWDASE